MASLKRHSLTGRVRSSSSRPDFQFTPQLWTFPLSQEGGGTLVESWRVGWWGVDEKYHQRDRCPLNMLWLMWGTALGAGAILRVVQSSSCPEARECLSNRENVDTSLPWKWGREQQTPFQCYVLYRLSYLVKNTVYGST